MDYLDYHNIEQRITKALESTGAAASPPATGPNATTRDMIRNSASRDAWLAKR
jgi:hypothetical protein